VPFIAFSAHFFLKKHCIAIDSTFQAGFSFRSFVKLKKSKSRDRLIEQVIDGSDDLFDCCPMNIHHLELFYFVTKFEGITAAVQKMPYGIQQPAVSGQILQLEDSLGLKLFNRRPFSLTPAGQELYEFIFPFFSKLNQIEQRLKGEESKHLRIAASSAVMRNHMPQVLAELQNRESNLKLTLREIELSDVHACLTSQQSDVAITLIHGNLGDGIVSEELLRLELVLYIPKNWEIDDFAHLLEDDPEGRGQVIDKPLIGMPEHELITNIFDNALAKQKIFWPVTIEVNSLDIIRQYVSLGFGSGIGVKIPHKKVEEGLKAIALPNIPPVVVGAIYQGKPKPLAQAFIKALKVKAKQLIS
jgi:DNA-binding transcriptional LysR family regulator